MVSACGGVTTGVGTGESVERGGKGQGPVILVLHFVVLACKSSFMTFAAYWVWFCTVEFLDKRSCVSLVDYIESAVFMTFVVCGQALRDGDSG